MGLLKWTIQEEGGLGGEGQTKEYTSKTSKGGVGREESEGNVTRPWMQYWLLS